MAYSKGKSRDAAEVQAPTGASLRKEKHPMNVSAGLHRQALIVNSDPAAARLCQDMLERLGFVVERASSGVIAVAEARRQVPDLIVMDFQLSDASAVETIGWLRANPSLMSTPIIVLGVADRSTLSVRNGGAISALGKPITPAAIERVVHDLCG